MSRSLLGGDRPRGIISWVVLGCLLELAGVTMVESKELRQAKVDRDIKVADAYVQGIAWDGKTLWVLDSKARELRQIDLQRQQVIRTVRVAQPSSPKGLAWDGKALWYMDNRAKRIVRIDPAEGRELKSFEAPIQFDRSQAVLEDVAWDGKSLWIAYSQGWSSSVLKIDAESGRRLQSMFAACHPRGLASDGRHLWIVSYNNGKHPGVITRWTISADDKKMILSRESLSRTPGVEPVGLALENQGIWIADKKLRRIQKLQIAVDE